MKKPKSLLRSIAFIFIWIVPLAYIGYIAIDITANAPTIPTTPTNPQGGSSVVFSVWALIVFATLLIVYIIQLRKRLIKVLDVTDIQGRPVPAFWRLVQLLEYAISFGLLIGLVYVISALSNVLYTFAIVSLISGTIGYVLLMIDSIKREKIYQENKVLGK
jgi:hypothetical protein